MSIGSITTNCFNKETLPSIKPSLFKGVAIAFLAIQWVGASLLSAKMCPLENRTVSAKPVLISEPYHDVSSEETDWSRLVFIAIFICGVFSLGAYLQNEYDREREQICAAYTKQEYRKKLRPRY